MVFYFIRNVSMCGLQHSKHNPCIYDSEKQYFDLSEQRKGYMYYKSSFGDALVAGKLFTAAQRCYKVMSDNKTQGLYHQIAVLNT